MGSALPRASARRLRCHSTDVLHLPNTCDDANCNRPAICAASAADKRPASKTIASCALNALTLASVLPTTSTPSGETASRRKVTPKTSNYEEKLLSFSSALSRQPVVSAHAMKARSMASATAAGATTGKSSKKLSVGTPKHLFRQVMNAAAARLNPTTLAPEPKGSAWAL